MSRSHREFEDSVVTEHRQKLAEPPLYKVLLHNDDYTAMDFVVMILETVFQKNTPEATRIMLDVHQRGIGVAGVYTRDLAETKVAIVFDMARKNEFPLRCSIEKV